MDPDEHLLNLSEKKVEWEIANEVQPGARSAAMAECIIHLAKLQCFVMFVAFIQLYDTLDRQHMEKKRNENTIGFINLRGKEISKSPTAFAAGQNR